MWLSFHSPAPSVGVPPSPHSRVSCQCSRPVCRVSVSAPCVVSVFPPRVSCQCFRPVCRVSVSAASDTVSPRRLSTGYMNWQLGGDGVEVPFIPANEAAGPQGTVRPHSFTPPPALTHTDRQTPRAVRPPVSLPPPPSTGPPYTNTPPPPPPRGRHTLQRPAVRAALFIVYFEKCTS